MRQDISILWTLIRILKAVVKQIDHEQEILISIKDANANEYFYNTIDLFNWFQLYLCQKYTIHVFMPIQCATIVHKIQITW